MSDKKEKSGVVLYRHLFECIQDQIKVYTTAYNSSAVQFAKDQKPESRTQFLMRGEYLRGLECAKKVITDNASVFAVLDNDQQGGTQ